MNAASEETRHPFLSALGDRVRDLRARKGLTRRAVAPAQGTPTSSEAAREVPTSRDRGPAFAAGDQAWY